MTPTSAGSTAYRPAPAAGQQQQQSWGGGGGGGGAAYAQAASMRFAAPISVSAPTTYTAPAYQQHNSVSTHEKKCFSCINRKYQEMSIALQQFALPRNVIYSQVRFANCGFHLINQVRVYLHRGTSSSKRFN